MNAPEKIYYQPVTGKIVDENYPNAVAYVPEYTIRQKDDIINTLHRTIEGLKNQIKAAESTNGHAYHDEIDTIPTRE